METIVALSFGTAPSNQNAQKITLPIVLHVTPLFCRRADRRGQKNANIPSAYRPISHTYSTVHNINYISKFSPGHSLSFEMIKNIGHHSRKKVCRKVKIACLVHAHNFSELAQKQKCSCW